MWQRLEPADLDLAKQNLGHRLAETLRRHEDEISDLRAAHANEIQLLEAKQGGINELEALIDRFLAEFETMTAAPAVVEGTEAGVRAETPSDPVGEQQVGSGDDVTNDVSDTEVSLPERLAVRYGSPNFTAFRRLAS